MKQAMQSNEIVVHEHSIVNLKFTAQWKDETGQHTGIQNIEKFNVWRDIDLLPPGLIGEILHQSVGKGKSHLFNCGSLISKWQENLVKTIPYKNYTGRLQNGEEVILKAGRYYPRGWFKGVDGFYSDNMFPARVVKVDKENILVDYNHPLSDFDINVSVEIVDIYPPSDEHGGRCSDALDLLLNDGPGMQLANKNNPSDFISESAFKRVDENSDELFYQSARKVHHLDAYARESISDLYGKLIEPNSRVLDLMASWESHIPDYLSNVELSGMGMNAEELLSNPLINDYLVQNLNNNPCLSYGSDMFDAVICTASIEYLIQPLKIFSEIKRVLKPGGLFIVTFSNRWFPTKVISLWSEMHEFERMGLVMEYFKQSDWQGQVNTFSSRGRHRPEDDPHYSQTHTSDPVYAVWCSK